MLCFLVFGVFRFVRQCLSFLSALVSQGPEAAREVLSYIRINKALSGLAKRKDKKVCSIFFSFQVALELLSSVHTVCMLTFFSENSPG